MKLGKFRCCSVRFVCLYYLREASDFPNEQSRSKLADYCSLISMLNLRLCFS